MKCIEKHTVPQQPQKIRLQEYAVGIFATVSTKSSIKKAIKKKLIFVDEKLASTGLFIKGGEIIELYQFEEKELFKRLILPLTVLFEDNYLAAIYKPAGIEVSGNKFVTIANGLQQNLQKSSLFDAVKPQPIHRLDYPTSGVLLIGKTSASILTLSKLFENKKITKTYIAICIGTMKNNGIIDTQIDNKPSISTYKVLQTVISKRFKFLNLVELQPKTGRKHQLRKHLFSIGNPILGDKDYGKEGLILNGNGLYLHAKTVEFIHPFTEEKMTITSEIPKKFKKVFPLEVTHS